MLFFDVLQEVTYDHINKPIKLIVNLKDTCEKADE